MYTGSVFVFSSKPIDYDNRVLNQVRCLEGIFTSTNIIIAKEEEKLETTPTSRRFNFKLPIYINFHLPSYILNLPNRIKAQLFQYTPFTIRKRLRKLRYKIKKRLRKLHYKLRKLRYKIEKRLRKVLYYIKKFSKIFRNLVKKFFFRQFISEVNKFLTCNLSLYKQTYSQLLVNNAGFNLIYANDLITLPAAIMLKFRFGTSVIYDMHEYEMYRYPPKPFSKKAFIFVIEECLIPFCDAVTTVSFSIRNVYKKRFKKLKINLVLSSASGSSPSDSDNLATKNLLNYRSLKVLYTGFISYGRNLEKTLNFAKENPNIEITFLGELREAFDNATHFSKHVENLPNLTLLEPIPSTELLSFAMNFDAILCSYDTSIKNYDFALPNKIMLGLNAKKPVLVSDSTEIRLFEKRHNILFPKINFDKMCLEDLSGYNLSNNAHKFYSITRQDRTIERIIKIISERKL